MYWSTLALANLLLLLPMIESNNMVTPSSNTVVNSGNRQQQISNFTSGSNLSISNEQRQSLQWAGQQQQPTVNNLHGYIKRNTTNKHSLIRSDSALLTRKMGYNAMLGSFIYSLSMVPLFLAITSIFTPPPHGFYGYGRWKRALVNESHIYRHLPLMNREETRRFLSLFETTLLNKKIYNENCKKYYSCKVFHNAISSGSFPTLPDFELALLNVFGIVAEKFDYKLDLIPTVRIYYDIATNAFKGVSCLHKYPCYDQHSSDRKLQNLLNVFKLSTEGVAVASQTRSNSPTLNQQTTS